MVTRRWRLGDQVADATLVDTLLLADADYLILGLQSGCVPVSPRPSSSPEVDRESGPFLCLFSSPEFVFLLFSILVLKIVIFKLGFEIYVKNPP